MRNISDTIERISAFRARANLPASPKSEDRLTDFLEFGSNPGALKARFYIPKSLRTGAPLVVVLHGCTQSAAGYDHGSGWSRLADSQGFALLFPEQQRANNANLCFNWFAPGDNQRGLGEALSIQQMIEAVAAGHDLDRRRIFITGLSAGGAMTSVMLATYPEIFAGGAIIAGLPYGCASTIPEAFDRMRGHGFPSDRSLEILLRRASNHDGPWPTLSMWHGTADRTVDPSNATVIIDQWRGVHGLDQSPDRTMVVDGRPRRVWLNRDGREVIEEFKITGMGHGTPLDTAGDAGLGASGPFMLEAGISSTKHISRFWDLAPAADLTQAASQASRQARREPPEGTGQVDEAEAGVELRPVNDENYGQSSSRASTGPVTGVRKIIEDALRAAGLMQ
jgi:poly(hydroxyalkanoate) depolymerase family esterase